jgi:hypothetical protein
LTTTTFSSAIFVFNSPFSFPLVMPYWINSRSSTRQSPLSQMIFSRHRSRSIQFVSTVVLTMAKGQARVMRLRTMIGALRLFNDYTAHGHKLSFSKQIVSVARP